MGAEFLQLFCFHDYTDKSLLVPLKKSFELNMKTMTSKKLGGLLMKLVLFISYYFSKN